MIQALGARVLRDACRQVVQWHRQNMPLRLSVNLSVQQLQHDSWLSVVEEALSSSGLAARHLDLEITESVIITHPEKAVATLMRLKQMGVSITVDDFGTGYSSLSYLARLPIQGVKIDQRFVHGLDKNRNDEAITQAIIALSHSLGLRCIAEGVETPAQFNFLKSHGCEEAQGYLIAHPLAESELRSWWRIQEELHQTSDRQADLWQRARIKRPPRDEAGGQHSRLLPASIVQLQARASASGGRAPTLRKGHQIARYAGRTSRPSCIRLLSSARLDRLEDRRRSPIYAASRARISGLTRRRCGDAGVTMCVLLQLHKIRRLVDVAKDAGIVDVDQLQRPLPRSDDRCARLRRR